MQQPASFDPGPVPKPPARLLLGRASESSVAAPKPRRLEPLDPREVASARSVSEEDAPLPHLRKSRSFEPYGCARTSPRHIVLVPLRLSAPSPPLTSLLGQPENLQVDAMCSQRSHAISCPDPCRVTEDEEEDKFGEDEECSKIKPKRLSTRLARRASADAGVSPELVSHWRISRQYLNLHLYRRVEQLLLWRSVESQAGQAGTVTHEEPEVALPGRASFSNSNSSALMRRGSTTLVLPESVVDDDPTGSSSLGLKQVRPDDASESSRSSALKRQSVYLMQVTPAEDTIAEAPPEDECSPSDELAKNKAKLDLAAAVIANWQNSPRSMGQIPGDHPLKPLLTAKKVNVEQLKKLLKWLPNAKHLLEAPLETTPTYIPKPLVLAVVANDPALVQLLVDTGADVLAPYDGPGVYKGWIKPNITLLESIQNRLGRFIGTMLGDKLQQMATVLKEAQEHAEKVREEEALRSASLAPICPAHQPDVAECRHTQGHPRQEYDIVEHIGDGDTSTCWAAWHLQTHRPFAIKAEVKSDEVDIWEEINLMKKISHPNIAQLYETFEDETKVFMVLELCQGGSFFEVANGVDEEMKSFVRSPPVMRQLAAAVAHLHSSNVCHRDVQLENFLLTEQKNVKLIDFTTAKEFVPGGDSLKTKFCTPSYVAREILSKSMAPYTEKVDVWSLGVVYFMLFAGTPPFVGDTDFEILKKVKRGSFKFEPVSVWEKVVPEVKDLIKQMITKEPTERLSAEQVLAHPYLTAV